MKNWSWIGGVASLAIPWFAILVFGLPVSPIIQVVFSGLAIIAAAFLLSWGAEVAQMEIPRSLAVAFVAIVAILPEYAVDIYVAGKAGRDPAYIPFAVANMTGANRLIIGIAWAMVAFLWWARSKKTSLEIDKGHGFEFSLLFLVTLYSFIIPFKKTLSLWDGAILVGFFLFYIWKASQGGVEEPELEGPVTAIAKLPRASRRRAILALFTFSFFAIVSAAKPFTEGLIATGRLWHVEEFLLIQLLAPLASEAPEFIVAGMLALRGNPSLGIGTLLSSKLSQWTLLVGMVPIVYTISLLTGGHAAIPLMLDGRQIDEIFLTAAQSFFAVAVVADFDLSLLDAGGLFSLYITQYFFPSPAARSIYAVIYLILGAAIFILRKKNREGVKLHFQHLRRSK